MQNLDKFFLTKKSVGSLSWKEEVQLCRSHCFFKRPLKKCTVHYTSRTYLCTTQECTAEVRNPPPETYTQLRQQEKTHNSCLTESSTDTRPYQQFNDGTSDKVTSICKPSYTQAEREGATHRQRREGEVTAKNQWPVQLDSDLNRKVCGLSVHMVIGCGISRWN